ncbi:MAG: alpha/beta hydrolase [Maricaulaceae bacterium]|jgi:acetyl esterase/lipase
MKRSIVAACVALAVAASPAGAQVDEPGVTGVIEEELVWARPDGLELQATIYRPEDAADGLSPTILDVHPGAWNLYDRTSGALYDRALAAAGFVVVAIDFRQGPEHQHPVGSRDVVAGVRWLRLNAETLGVDPDRIGMVGSSSGGHLALLAGLRPDHPDHAGTPIVGPDGEAAAHDDLDGSVDFIAALWPVSDPQYRYRYAQRAGIDQLVGYHDAYFADEAAMYDASAPRLVTSGEAAVLPPVLVVQPGMDSNIPVEMTFDLMRAYQSRDGHIEYAYYPGMPHAFGHRPGPETDDMIELMIDFAQRQFSSGD